MDGLLTEQELRNRVERLAELERGSGSEGERAGAELIASELHDLGARVSVEAERVHGTFWWPIGLANALAAVAGVRGGALGVAGGALAAASAAEDIAVGPRLMRRTLLRGHTTHNVIGELGDPDAPQTLVFVAHHDAAHSGLVFHPDLARWPLKRSERLRESMNTTPPTMWGAVAAPAAVALGALLRNKPLRLAGAVVAAGHVAAMADIGLRGVVPGANDNATGVATLLSLAHSVVADPPEGVRVVLLCPGSEEALMEGMRAYMRRHAHELPRESTSFVCVDTVGSPRLLLLEGEGMLGMREYPKDFLALIHDAAQEVGVELLAGLRFRNATDGVVALKAGYRTAMIGSVDEYKIPTDYHWPTDTADRVDYGSVAGAARVCRRMVERLAAPQTAAAAAA